MGVIVALRGHPQQGRRRPPAGPERRLRNGPARGIEVCGGGWQTRAGPGASRPRAWRRRADGPGRAGFVVGRPWSCEGRPGSGACTAPRGSGVCPLDGIASVGRLEPTSPPSSRGVPWRSRGRSVVVVRSTSGCRRSGIGKAGRWPSRAGAPACLDRRRSAGALDSTRTVTRTSAVRRGRGRRGSAAVPSCTCGSSAEIGASPSRRIVQQGDRELRSAHGPGVGLPAARGRAPGYETLARPPLRASRTS